MPQRGLPTLSDHTQAIDVQKNTQIALAPTISLPSTPRAPWNFRAVSQRGGVLLQWSALKEVDGYEIFHSETGDFTGENCHVHSLRDPSQTEFFHATGGDVEEGYFKLRATSGTASNPYAVHGIFTGVIKQSSLDSNDTVTVPTTLYDTTTTDRTQAKARAWKSGTNSPHVKK